MSACFLDKRNSGPGKGGLLDFFKGVQGLGF